MCVCEVYVCEGWSGMNVCWYRELGDTEVEKQTGPEHHVAYQGHVVLVFALFRKVEVPEPTCPTEPNAEAFVGLLCFANAMKSLLGVSHFSVDGVCQ